ncbi:GNAT family N-acetyltransferase [Vibrio sp. 03-59-1]|uniref:GNAT family N-acetyltransferase n=1 Tax=Vibrio sp. 03-59-1 TaxID=2607607 RepID=UPI0014935274|nr:GNAT family N-acetyltransferase [Vibrio sp. 03-59-1]NOH84835.1 GNAT family N-acetyltransferase [Vibrio sp. 03-59-1]
MSVDVRVGDLQEVIAVVESIDEFVRGETIESLQLRLQGKKQLILVAEEEGTLLGFKIGYQLDDDTFYSWFGGVSPIARNKGVAQALLNEQERWVESQQYQYLKVKSRNQFPVMLRLLLRNGYAIEHFEKKEPLSASSIHFVKQLTR